MSSGWSRVLLLVAAVSVPAGHARAEEVSFPTPDGGRVFADLYGDGNRAVVLAHGGQFDKESWREQVPAFVAAGFRVLAIDFRGRGMSRGGPGSAGDEDAYRDVVAAVDYLRRTGATRISLVGASFGGGAVARAVTELPAGQIENVVLLAHSPIARPEALTGRKLFILTREDFQGSGTLRLPSIQEQYDRSPEPKELVILPGSAHAQHVFDTQQGPRLLDEIIRFLRGERSGDGG